MACSDDPELEPSAPPSDLHSLRARDEELDAFVKTDEFASAAEHD